MFLVLACLFALSSGVSLVTTLAGSKNPYDSNDICDGVGSAALFGKPTGVAAFQNNLYVADQGPTPMYGRGTGLIRAIAVATANVTTLAGNPNRAPCPTGHATDGVGSNACFAMPAGITVDGNSGILYIADGSFVTSTGAYIRAVNIVTKIVTTLAGNIIGNNIIN